LAASMPGKKHLSTTYKLPGHGPYTVDQVHSTPDQRQSALVLPELVKALFRDGGACAPLFEPP
jgi:hypothetical protein